MYLTEWSKYNYNKRNHKRNTGMFNYIKNLKIITGKHHTHNQKVHNSLKEIIFHKYNRHRQKVFIYNI